MPDAVVEALEALAKLRAQSLSDLLEDLGRKELESLGAGPQITAEDIAEAVKLNRMKKLEKGAGKLRAASETTKKKQAAQKHAA